MKLKIKVKKLDNNLILPKIIDKGDWIDLTSSKKIKFNAPKVVDNTVTFDYKLIPLGIAMELPKGFEAIVAPRSSTFKSYGIIESNSIGIIDNSYCGDNDQWHFPAIAYRNVTVREGDRVCQFKIQLSQKATFMQKLKWLFSSSIELIEVEHLNNKERGGFGSTN